MISADDLLALPTGIHKITQDIINEVMKEQLAEEMAERKRAEENIEQLRMKWGLVK